MVLDASQMTGSGPVSVIDLSLSLSMISILIIKLCNMVFSKLFILSFKTCLLKLFKLVF